MQPAAYFFDIRGCKIHEQGAKRRQDAETELVKVEQELKQALLEAGSK